MGPIAPLICGSESNKDVILELNGEMARTVEHPFIDATMHRFTDVYDEKPEGMQVAASRWYYAMHKENHAYCLWMGITPERPSRLDPYSTAMAVLPFKDTTEEEVVYAGKEAREKILEAWAEEGTWPEIRKCVQPPVDMDSKEKVRAFEHYTMNHTYKALWKRDTYVDTTRSVIGQGFKLRHEYVGRARLAGGKWSVPIPPILQELFSGAKFWQRDVSRPWAHDAPEPTIDHELVAKLERMGVRVTKEGQLAAGPACRSMESFTEAKAGLQSIAHSLGAYVQFDAVPPSYRATRYWTVQGRRFFEDCPHTFSNLEGIPAPACSNSMADVSKWYRVSPDTKRMKAHTAAIPAWFAMYDNGRLITWLTDYFQRGNRTLMGAYVQAYYPAGSRVRRVTDKKVKELLSFGNLGPWAGMEDMETVVEIKHITVQIYAEPWTRAGASALDHVLMLHVCCQHLAEPGIPTVRKASENIQNFDRQWREFLDAQDITALPLIQARYEYLLRELA